MRSFDLCTYHGKKSTSNQHSIVMNYLIYKRMPYCFNFFKYIKINRTHINFVRYKLRGDNNVFITSEKNSILVTFK